MLALVLCVMVALCEGATAAALHPHHERHHRRLEHLQDAVDRLLLRQRTDHILITNLQKAVKEVREGNAWTDGILSAPVKEVEDESRALASLRDRVQEVKGAVSDVLEAEERRDDILEIRQELAFLRSEVKRLKEARAAESEQSAAHSHAQEQREAVTAAWVVDNVRRLQDSVVELQQALNVTAAMHDKQEVESRLLVVTKDLAALRGSLAAVTSKAEAAAATTEALQEEMTRTSQDAHHTAGKVAALTTEVTGIREDFNSLLAALPEGTVAGVPAAAPAAAAKDDQGSAGASHSRLEEKVAELQHRTDDLDFAVARTQQQVAASLPIRGAEDKIAKVAESERQLEIKVDAAQAGVGEVRASSVQLLAAVEALEARMEKKVVEVKQEVAKLEFKVAESVAAQQGGEAATREAHDDATALRTDLQAVSRRLDHISGEMAMMQGRALQGQVDAAQCRSKQLALDLKLNETQQRLSSLEKRHSHNHRHRHSIHLPPWRDSTQEATQKASSRG